MAEQPPRSSRGIALLLAVVIGGSALGAFVYQLGESKKALPLDVSGFDVAKTEEVKRPRAPAAAAKDASGLGMVEGGVPPGGATKAAAPQGELDKAREAFSASARESEARLRSLAERAIKGQPAVAQAGKDWMASVELKRLHDEYLRDHDPVKLLKSLAASKDFWVLDKRHASKPSVRDLVKESLRTTSSKSISGAAAYLRSDPPLKDFVLKVGASLGLSPGTLAGLLSGGKIDEKQTMEKVNATGLRGN